MGLSKHAQFIALLRANNSGCARSTGVRSGEDGTSNAFVKKEAYEKDWDIDRVITATEAEESGLQGRFCADQGVCWFG